ncbi:MAG: SH3 domain-containing protein [Planctomycetota bacterium]
MRCLAFLLLTLVLAGTARAEDPPAPGAPAPEPPAAPDDVAPPSSAEDGAGAEPPPQPPPPDLPRVGRVRGQRVNVRVGPRIGGRPVTQVDDGEVVRVIERLPGWVGVTLPRGFKVAVADEYLQVVDPDTVLVTADRLTLRLDPPAAEGGDPGPAFTDRVERGARLVRIEPAAPGWTWVVAPEPVRVYIHADYVDVAPADLADAERGERAIEAARAHRAAWVKELADARLENRRRRAESALRDALGTVQEGLYHARNEGGFDRAPIVVLANQLDQALDTTGEAPAPLRRVATALRDDLEGEIALRVARRDAAIARARGLDPGPDARPAPTVSQVRLTGVLRFEPVPGWRTGGAWILWTGDEPTHVVQLTAGMPLPHPNLRDYEGKVHTYVGKQPGERLFGLPVVDLAKID